MKESCWFFFSFQVLTSVALNDLCLNLGFVQFELFGREFSQGSVRSEFFFFFFCSKGLFVCFLLLWLLMYARIFIRLELMSQRLMVCQVIQFTWLMANDEWSICLRSMHAWCMYEPMRILVWDFFCVVNGTGMSHLDLVIMLLLLLLQCYYQFAL